MRSENVWFSLKGILFIVSGFFVFLMAPSSPCLGATQWDVGVSGGDEGLRSFHLSIGEYYHVPGGWQRGDLRDADIVNQVNLKFISEHHRYAPEKVMKYRSNGKSFTTIDRDVKMENGKEPAEGSAGNQARQ
jgi:hypothetical protein